jgi:hypothetical protein
VGCLQDNEQVKTSLDFWRERQITTILQLGRFSYRWCWVGGRIGRGLIEVQANK